MKVPNKIKTLTELVKWIEENNPKTLEISLKSNLLKIREFSTGVMNPAGGYSKWKHFRGIKIEYLG